MKFPTGYNRKYTNILYKLKLFEITRSPISSQQKLIEIFQLIDCFLANIPEITWDIALHILQNYNSIYDLISQISVAQASMR